MESGQESELSLVDQINELVEAVNVIGGFVSLLEANWGEGLYPIEKLSIGESHEVTDVHDALVKIKDYLKEVTFRIRRMASEMQALRRTIGLPDRRWTGDPREDGPA